MVRMFRDANVETMQQMYAAILKWKCCKPIAAYTRIHGRYDPSHPPAHEQPLQPYSTRYPSRRP